VEITCYVKSNFKVRITVCEFFRMSLRNHTSMEIQVDFILCSFILHDFALIDGLIAIGFETSWSRCT
jgi:hypothetical protein